MTDSQYLEEIDRLLAHADEQRNDAIRKYSNGNDALADVYAQLSIATSSLATALILRYQVPERVRIDNPIAVHGYAGVLNCNNQTPPYKEIS